MKLASKFADVEHVVLNSADKVESWIEKRGSRIFLTVLDERGKTFKSREFAAEVQKFLDRGFAEWVILCGSEHGNTEAVKSKANQILSLSAFTFPHEMAVSVVAEQIFRVLTILEEYPYHND